MSYVTASTAWPTNQVVPSQQRALIQRLFSLSDTPRQDVGDRLATEVFSPDAIVMIGPNTHTGSEEVSKSQQSAWDEVESREHKVLKVYTCNEQADDLLLIGHRRARMKDGKTIEYDFTARLVFKGVGDSLRISLLKS